MDQLRISPRRLLVAVALLVIAPTLAAPSAAASTTQETSAQETFEHQLLAKAVPDECFDGIGNPYPAGPPCATGQAKVNQGYVWGLTRARNKIYFGTGANVNCLTSARNLKSTTPTLNADYVCEYGESQIVKANPTLPPTYGDFRPPQIFTYDLAKHQLVDRSPEVKAFSQADAQRLGKTAGLRAGGNFGGVAFLAGPALGASINMFAFDTDTGAYLGSASFPAYGNIRHFLVADGALYAGVGVGTNGSNQGHVLRWMGSKTDPFNFVNVANLPAQAADLAFHKGRIYVTTWGSSDSGGDLTGDATSDVSSQAITSMAAVVMSPPLKSGDPGLTAADADGWSTVWSVDQYEPDSIVAGTTALGGLASYGGYLYWGTMHVPLKATVQHLAAHPPVDETAAQATIQNSQRAIGIFRGKDFGTATASTELLYGAPELPAWDDSVNDGLGGWTRKSTGYTPKFGSSGFGNPYLNYTWTMLVTDGKLFVGTMDWSYLKKDFGAAAAAQSANPLVQGAIGDITASAVPDPTPYFGGDLWVFDSPDKAATLVDGGGLGNYLNYGIRNMVADGDTLYLGMANPMNLRTDPTDDIPEGGWELIKLEIEDCH